MTKSLANAYATYEATISPASITRLLAAAGRPGIITADGIRAGALLTLQAAIVEEAGSTPNASLMSESAIRGRAKRLGYTVSKSRQRSLHSNNRRQFQLCDHANTVVLGVDYGASLEDIAWYLSERLA